MRWLFDSSGFLPRDKCGGWGEILPIISQTANLLIALAYILIPLILFSMYRRLKKKEVIPKIDILLWFGAFIILCGFGHICDYFAFSWPAYRFFTLIDILTAIASIGTCAKIPEAVEEILKLPSRADLEKANKEKDTQLIEYKDLAQQLRTKEQIRIAEIAELERQLQVIRGGGTGAEEILNDLLSQLSTIQKVHAKRGPHAE